MEYNYTGLILIIVLALVAALAVLLLCLWRRKVNSKQNSDDKPQTDTCPFCKRELDEDEAIFCPYCGKRLIQ